MRNRIVSLFVVIIAVSAIVGMIGGCGYIHGTDGRTVSILGFGRVTDAQTQTEWGIGGGMNSNLSNPRANTFSDRSVAVAKMYGGEEK